MCIVEKELCGFVIPRRVGGSLIMRMCRFRTVACAIGVAGLTTASMLLVQVAEAAPVRGKRQPKAPRTELAALPQPVRPAPPAIAAPAPIPPVAVVSLGAQSITIYSGTDIVAKAPISSGQPGYRTPTGIFSIIQKNRYHESNIYSGAPMPFMQRLTWSGIALHAGNLPGYAASHGCVRLPYDFAQRLFSMTKMGARVIVTPEQTSPVAFTHARMPTPVMTPYIMTASAPLLTGSALTLAAAGSHSTDAPVERLLNPVQAAEVEKRRATGAAADAAQKAKSALDAATTAARESDAASAARVELDREIQFYRDQNERASRTIAAATNDEDKVQALATAHALDEALDDANAALADTRKAEINAYEQSFTAARAARDAEDAAEAAEIAARVASRGTEPMTVFISRKEGRVMIRQGFHPVIDGEVTINDAQVPLGTHVFTAVSASSADASLRWTSVSVSDGGARGVSAAAALDRITIDPAFAAEIGKRLWIGATLIISDQGISNETGKGTDFVVLTK